MSGTSRGDEWLRRGAKPRGTIDPEPRTGEPTVGERASAAIRNAARRARPVQLVTQLDDDQAGQGT